MLLNLTFFLLISLKLVNALEFIHTQDQQRIVKYAEARKEQDAHPYTQTINTHLTDHSKIDYHRTATEQDKEIIFKAVIGGVIIHKDYSLARLTTISDVRYKSHCDALEVVNQSSQLLWKSVLRKNYVYGFEQIDTDLKRISSAKGFDYQSLLTVHFFKWFYESLESYQHELNLFGGTATVRWLQESVENYGKQNTSRYDLGKNYSRNRSGVIHEYIHDGKKGFIAVLKPKSDSTRHKGEIDDWKISILAKSAGLIDSINPAIPIRLEGKKVIIDCNNFTHILEPFVGVTGSKTGDKFETGNADMDTLLQHTFLSLTDDDKEKAKLKLPTVGTFSSYTFKLHTFAKYFENTSISADQRFRDLQTFNRSIDTENLLKLITFWQLIKLRDMHDGNILWSLNPDGKFIITCIDYNLCFTDTEQVPPLSMLLQATQPLAPDNKGRILDISPKKLEQVRRQWLPTLASITLGNNLTAIQAGVRGNSNLRQLMQYFYLQKEGKGYYKKKRSELPKEISSTLTVYDPLEIRPLGDKDPASFGNFPYKAQLKGYTPILVEKVYGQGAYTNYQIRRNYDWVFHAKTIDELTQEQYFKSALFPFEYMWRNGLIPSNLLFDDRYLEGLPS